MMNGFPKVIAPDGGGAFSRMMVQTMPARQGALCIFAPPPAEDGCCGGCCDDPGCDTPVPDTGHGIGGVLDEELTLRWGTDG
jgi:hypothetical protein